MPIKFDLDEIIKKLLTNKAWNIGTTNDELTEDNISTLIDKARDLFTSQPVFL